MKARAWILAGVFSLCAIIACGPAQGRPDPTRSPSQAAPPSGPLDPSPTAAKQSSGKCSFDATVEVWEDLNANALREPDEPAMPGIHVLSLYRGQPDPAIDALTGPDGSLKVNGTTDKCDLANFQVTLDGLPAGYHVSTRTPLALTETNEGGVLDFGVALQNGAVP